MLRLAVDEISFYAFLSSQIFSSKDLMPNIPIPNQKRPADHLLFVQMNIAAEGRRERPRVPSWLLERVCYSSSDQTWSCLTYQGS
jgi:hypothetical protein